MNELNIKTNENKGDNKMCNCCENLIECPIGEKRKSVLIEGDFGLKTEIVVDRYKDHIETFMHTMFTDKDGYWHNNSINVSFCPICGRALNT